MTMPATSRTVLLVGANGGVGSALARRLVAEGFAVVATVSRPEKLDAYSNSQPGLASVTTLGLSNAQEVRERVAALVADLDRLDAVVSCSAMSPFGPAETTPLEQFNTTMEVNCVANLALYQATIPALRASRGHLVVVGSLSGRVATPMMCSYVASKFALEGLVDVIRQESAQWGVKTSLLEPGGIDTPMIERSRDAVAIALADLAPEAHLYRDMYAQMLARLSVRRPAGTMTSPEEVADVVLRILDDPDADARYPIGADARYLIEASRTRSDREVDAIVLKAYRSVLHDP